LKKKKNNTGLPDTLKAGLETLSGYSLDDVKVHYNSDKPTQLQAHTYAEGSDIHLQQGKKNIYHTRPGMWYNKNKVALRLLCK
jgi:hypothetical protein